MKKLFALLVLLALLPAGYAQTTGNFISATIDGKEWKAEAKRLRIPISGFNYLALAGFEVSPDVQLWIRLYYLDDELRPGTYPIESLEETERKGYRPKSDGRVWALVDYTEETKNLGHGFHDGESMNGTLTITSVTPTSIEGTFEGTLKGVYYQKRGLATVTGTGLRSNLERKLLTKAGAGMVVNTDPHDHENTKKTNETDTITLTNGKFKVDWSKESKE
jgi:hypothetical protein